MNGLDVYKLANVDSDVLWNTIHHKYPVHFDDGVLEMTGTEISISAQCWRLCLKYNAPIVINTAVTAYKKSDQLLAKFIHIAQNETLWHIVDACNISIHNVFDVVKDILVINNLLYNDIVIHCGEFIKSPDILDFINLALCDKFIESRTEVDRNGYKDKEVAEAMIDAENYILTDKHIRKDNVIAWLVSHGLAKSGPAIQSTFFRGFVYEIDKEKISTPITYNLTEGMDVTTYNLLSREASVHMAAGNGDIQDTTIDGRKLSYVCNVKYKITNEDCGCRDYVDVIITDESGGTHVGQWYTLDKHDHNLIKFKAGDEERLLGKHIYKRSPLTCQTSNPANVCRVCFGDMSYSFIHGRNVGMSEAKAIATIFIQKSISTKHYATSSGSMVGTLSKNTKNVFRVKNNLVYLQRKLGANLIMRLPVDAVSDLERINGVNPSVVPRSQLTNIKCGEIIRTTTRTSTEYQFDLSAMLSHDLALYISINYEEVISRKGGDCYIDIHRFDKSKPVFEMAEILQSAKQNSNAIISVLQRGVSNNKTGRANSNVGFNEASYMDTYMFLLNQMGKPYGICAAVIEHVLSAYLMPNKSYGLAKGIVDVNHGTVGELIGHRSKATTMLHDPKKVNFLFNPSSVLHTNTPDSPLDVFVDPINVVKYRDLDNIEL